MTARGIALRCFYAAGVVAVAVLAFNLPAIASDVMSMPEQFLSVALPAAMAGFATVGIPLVVLTVRPYWWGKLFVLWPAFSWAGFAGALTLIDGWSSPLSIPLACATTMLAIAVAHQILDPRFSGAPLT